MELFWFFLIGAVVGWLAGLIMKGSGFGLAGNIIIGILGAITGGFLRNVLGFGSGPVGFLTALIGAIVLLFLIGLIRKGTGGSTTPT